MRPAKRLRSVASASRTMSEPPTRVFALWKQDGHYYSGTVHSLQSPSSTRYLVKFDDNTEDVVDITRMRRCQLKVGDNVIMVEGGLRGKVTYADGLETEGVVRVEVDNGSKVITSEVETADIRIASRTLASQWKDRMLSAELIVAMVKPKPIKATPSPSKVSIQSTTSTKSESKVLAKTGLVVTLSATNSNRDADRDTVTSLIKSHGGVVIEEWSNIFLMNGTHSQGNKRWVALKDDIRWNPKYGIERVFLLSDDANQKPKFLIALALGIPCISFDWLLRGLKMGGEREKEWQSYLLPAGFSEVLHARVSQLIDMDWGNSPEHLSEIMYNPVASKLFSLKSVVCVGADFVPLPRAKKVNSDAERAKEASRTVPYIILAMGADRVEAVSDIKYASKSDLASFDYVVVKDNGEAGVSLRQDGVKLVHLSWVKDCLIAGRLLSMH
ncbi:hypothetical protein SERLA73DRAFT_189814 [Serpula lacrymans var. lacrymans S7.3]|uniref:BRCT domain-containing protein n=2 Tax=Serpula lacrymans var. lacrymans TaxID=341189 RepID=F8QEL3_SERL3|nr:uncharacterized protein SERLADRAFT_480926 [Serpula lacrymans var. lacrymans S7.9]EGN93269.1 hypothetical protein SERLA73DRAFT_189814 [Serpula lacrymans var. lacrymans S7.3]EGO18652.1 hypothetical protein SERLADRAFT_480926 [Serpula lacrymans var. lacrymans S7.9]